MAVKTRLEIQGESEPLVTDIPISATLQLADIREPDKRNASFTKTIQLYGNSRINKIFENIFEANISAQTYNQNKKIPAKYYQDDALVFQGDLQLLLIRKEPDHNIVYECNIIGQEGSLFLDIGDKELTNLDFSAYNHSYTRSNQISSWSNTPGSGYYYPFINRGTNGGSETVFSVSDFTPCFYARDYVYKIIQDAGYTVQTSSFLNSAFFKSLIIFPNIDGIPLSQSQLDARQFYVGLNSDVPITLGPPTNINYNNESAPFFDTGSQVSGTTVTLTDSSHYNIAAQDYWRFSFTHTDPTVAYCIVDLPITSKLIMYSTDGGATYSALASASNYYNGQVALQVNVGANSDYVNVVATGDTFRNGGDKLQARTLLTYQGIRYYTAGNVQVTTGVGTPSFKLLSGANKTSLYTLVTQKVVTEGNTLLANNALPIKIKQKDFLKSIIQLFNLYIDVDKTNPKSLTIESYIDFYGASTVNWSDKSSKIDKDKEVSVNPSLLEGKRYIYTYKDDKDYWNDRYKQTWQEVFGTKIVDIDNDFIKTDKTNEVIFSATPNVANYDLGIAHPKMFNSSDGVHDIKPITPNIRILIAGGVKQTASVWTYKSNLAADLVDYNYGYAGHVDDPFNPTEDLNFGTPKEVYYSYINAAFTTNNSYNKYHDAYLTNITSKDSRIIIPYLWLSGEDINKFSFRNKYFIDEAYYIFNKIVDYNPLSPGSTKCELIKLLDLAPFTPQTVSIYNTPSISSGGNVNRQIPNTSQSFGTNNQITGENVVAIGNNIQTDASNSNLFLQGDNIQVAKGVSNVVAIGCNNMTLSNSNVTYVNNVLTSVWNPLYSAAIEVTASSGFGFVLNMDSTHGTVFCACNMANVDCVLPDPSTVTTIDADGMLMSKIYTIVKIDSTANPVNVYPAIVGPLINGLSTFSWNTQYKAYQFQTDGTNWYTIN